jgi:CHAT domain-containing protein
MNCEPLKSQTGGFLGRGNFWLDSALENRTTAYLDGETAKLDAELLRAIGDRRVETYALANIGGVYEVLGEKRRALEYYNLALPLSRAVGDRYIEATTLNGIGKVYDLLGERQKALEYYNRALPLRRAIGDRRSEANTLKYIGEVYSSLGDKQKAADYYNQALLLERAVGDRDDEADTLGNFMSLWSKVGKRALAIFYGKQSINTYQQLRSNIQGLEKEVQQTYIHHIETRYRQLADLLISEGRLPEARQVISMLKEEEYFEFIRRDIQEASTLSKRATLTPKEAEWERRYQEISDQLTVIGKEHGELLAKKARTAEEEQRLAKLEKDLEVSNRHFQRFLDQLSEEFGNSKEANFRVMALKETQGLMEDLRELGSGAVALYTIVGQDKYRVILVTPDVQKGFEYRIKEADLNRKVASFREVLQNPNLNPLPLAQELYRILVGPVANDLKQANAQTLMWSLDGVLRYIPIAALHDGKQYLVERYRNVVFTPASNSRLKDQPTSNWRVGFGVSKAYAGASALPNVPEELYSIIRDDSVGNKARGEVLPGIVLLDEAFTAQAMKTALHQRYQVVHIASHFAFRPGNETNSALLLGDGSLMTLAEIKNSSSLFGGVELLTLSACDTATGGAGADGREVEGFGVLAQRQGAKAVVASLWPVADKATQLLMQKFYGKRNAPPWMLKAEALRQAQLALLLGEENGTEASEQNRQLVRTSKNAGTRLPEHQAFKIDPKAPYAHPYYWAPFVLIGNWK